MINVLKRVGIGTAVLVGVCAFYTGYRELFLATGWTWPFEVDDITLPSLPSIVGALFDPVQAGSLELANRIVMAPLTRNRAPGAIQLRRRHATAS